MKNFNEFVPQTFEEVIASFKKSPQSGINYEVLAQGIKNGDLSSDELAELSGTFVQGYNLALKACFPRDAFRSLIGQNLIAEYIPANESLDLGQEWDDIAELLHVNIPQKEITTNVAFKHFLREDEANFPNHEETAGKISAYISECIRRAHEDDDPELLQRVIPAFRLLGYFYKLFVGTDYWCESEYDDVVRFGVDEAKMDFVTLKTDQVAEKFQKQANLMKNE